MKKILLLALGMGLFSCTESKEITTNNMPLRQMNYERNIKEQTNASFFLIMGSYSKSEVEENKVRMFAKVDNGYRFLDIPLRNISVVIDNNVKIPYINFKHGYSSNENFFHYIKYDLSFDDYTCYIYVSENYLPEKLIPIEL